MTGWGAGDYYALLSTYEALLQPVAHYVVLGDLDEILRENLGFQEDPVRITPPVHSFGWLQVREVMHPLHLEFVWVTMRRLASGGLRFRPGPAKAPRTGPRGRLEPEVVRTVLSMLLARATRPLTVLFTPRMPQLNQGRIRLDEPRADEVELLRQACAEVGVDFIDATPAFHGLYQRTGRLPRGYQNRVPGGGHWNADGHRLVAEAVLNHLSSRRDAVHTD